MLCTLYQSHRQTLQTCKLQHLSLDNARSPWNNHVYSVTANLRSSVNMMPYMNCIIFIQHYFNSNWEVKSRCLDRQRSTLQLHWGNSDGDGHSIHLAVTYSMKAEKKSHCVGHWICRTLVTTFSYSLQKKKSFLKDILIPKWQEMAVMACINATLKNVSRKTLSSEKTVTACSGAKAH